MVIPLVFGRPKSKAALDEIRNTERPILLVTQRDGTVEDPTPKDLHEVGCLARVVQLMDLPDDTVRAMIEGVARVRVTHYVRSLPFLEAYGEPLAETEYESPEIEATMREVVAQFERAVTMSRHIPPDAVGSAMSMREPGKLADFVCSCLGRPPEEKQEILETGDVAERLDKVHRQLIVELGILELEQKIHARVRDEMSSSQREFYLREQLRAIQDELGEREGGTHEADEYRQKIEAAGMSAEAAEKALREVERLERIPPVAPEGTVIRTYLDWLVALPWKKSTRDKINIGRAEAILDEDHYGLKKPKERVLEFLAVRKLVRRTKGPILAFIGPPGVGKTSIGRSIARALGRKFIRISLGGVRDEAEIRGHRRTYVGALPGRIMQGIRDCSSHNPVFMLDEIDKLGIDFRGDPSSALLEALDPEQNGSFSDHYLEVPFDLSRVMFIATGNVLATVPPALRDRMEVIEFPGYVDEEKLAIAKGFLVTKQVKDHGLKPAHLQFTDKALRAMIRGYTREAGVRELERKIATACRKTAKRVAAGDKSKLTVTPKNVEDLLGLRIYLDDDKRKENQVGVATGLAFTETGGETLQVEVAISNGKGEILLTGRLGEVMKESAQAALSYARTKAEPLSLAKDFFQTHDFHVHVPSGAVPKEGPSAGVTIATAILSALGGREVRYDVAMTGEVTLHGRVLPVGGVREKVLAAHRSRIPNVVIPKENEKDLKELDDLPEDVRQDMTFIFATTMDQVVAAALV
ncbi:MAG: endopeptidase La [Armatimonadetes bacterium]|nr:endopeptidase La [Armatimonadota bacterium]